MILVYHRYL